MATQDSYDLVIVGAGPAGLSAARTAARLGFDTLVVEQRAGPDDLGHPCSAVLTPAPDLVSGKQLLGGLFFPHIDLWIPDSLIRVHDSALRCFSPGGYEFQTVFSQDSNGGTAIVDQAGLLRLMAEQAAGYGVEFRYGIEVLGLLRVDDRVTGVRTDSGDISAGIVLSAEGGSRALVHEAHCFVSGATQYQLVIEQRLSAPAVRHADLGRTVMLGQCHPDLPNGYGVLTMPEPGQAVLTYTAMVDGLDCAAADFAGLHLDTCLADSRIKDLLAGAKPVSQSWHALPMQGSPLRVVADGFMGIGDAIAPAGHLGMLPSMYLGRQAALIAAEALDAGDVSEAYLAPYEQLFMALILPQLEVESKTTAALTKLTDTEVDRLSQLLNWLHLPAPFLGYRRNVEWETVGTLVSQSSLDQHDWDLLKMVLPSSTEPQADQFIVPSIAPVSRAASAISA